MNQKIQLHLLKIIGFPPFSQKLNNSSTYKGTLSLFQDLQYLLYYLYKEYLIWICNHLIFEVYLYNTQHTIDKHEAKIYVFSTAGDNSAFFMLS